MNEVKFFFCSPLQAQNYCAKISPERKSCSERGAKQMKQDERKDYASRNMAGVAYGEMIRNSRRKKGMSQEELGALAHVGKNAVGAWEAGRSRPDLSSVPVICENLGISINDFFGIPEAADQQKGKQIPDETVRDRKSVV